MLIQLSYIGMFHNFVWVTLSKWTLISIEKKNGLFYAILSFHISLLKRLKIKF